VRATVTPWPTAIHEAGHAVVSRALGRSVRKITVIPDEDSLGHTLSHPLPAWFNPEHHWDGRVRNRLEQMVMIFCAGGIAQGRVDPDEAAPLWGSIPDLERATELCLYASGGNDDEAAAYLEWLRLRAFRIVWNPIWWAGIESLATALLSQPKMTGRQANSAIQVGLDRVLTEHRQGLK
jgi:hypothetical protein